MAKMNLYKGIAIMLFCTLFTAAGQFFLKLGSQTLDITNIVVLLTNYNLFIGLFLYAIGAFLLVYALKLGDLNVIYPIVSLTFVWVAILSLVLLKEPISTNKLIGIPVILSGVFFMARGAK